MMKKVTSKSPLKEPLLRLPAQSIDEQIDRLLNDKQLNYALLALGCFLFAAVAWIQVLTGSPLNPEAKLQCQVLT